MHNSQLLRNSNHKSPPAQLLSDGRFASSHSTNLFPVCASQSDLVHSLTNVTFLVLRSHHSSGRRSRSLHLPKPQIIYYIWTSHVWVEQMKQGKFEHISAPHFGLQKLLLHVKLDFETTVEHGKTCFELRFTQVETIYSCGIRRKWMRNPINLVELPYHKTELIRRGCA